MGTQATVNPTARGSAMVDVAFARADDAARHPWQVPVDAAPYAGTLPYRLYVLAYGAASGSQQLPVPSTITARALFAAIRARAHYVHPRQALPVLTRVTLWERAFMVAGYLDTVLSGIPESEFSRIMSSTQTTITAPAASPAPVADLASNGQVAPAAPATNTMPTNPVMVWLLQPSMGSDGATILARASKYHLADASNPQSEWLPAASSDEWASLVRNGISTYLDRARSIAVTLGAAMTVDGVRDGKAAILSTGEVAEQFASKIGCKVGTEFAARNDDLIYVGPLHTAKRKLESLQQPAQAEQRANTATVQAMRASPFLAPARAVLGDAGKAMTDDQVLVRFTTDPSFTAQVLAAMTAQAG